MPYSIVKIDDGFVIRVGDQDFLKMNSRRKAAKLISDVRRSAPVGLEDIGDSGVMVSDVADTLPHEALRYRRA